MSAVSQHRRWVSVLGYGFPERSPSISSPGPQQDWASLRLECQSGGKGRKKRRKTKKSSAVGRWDVGRAGTFGNWSLGGLRKVWLLGPQLHLASSSARWTLFCVWIPWLQQGYTALTGSQTVALRLILVYTFNLQLQKSLLSFCLNLLRPHPMICAFKLALLTAKVLKLSLGVSESRICLFCLLRS